MNDWDRHYLGKPTPLPELSRKPSALENWALAIVYAVAFFVIVFFTEQP